MAAPKRFSRRNHKLKAAAFQKRLSSDSSAMVQKLAVYAKFSIAGLVESFVRFINLKCPS